MSEIKKKRYPSDRLRLHALLEKKEQELLELQGEVQELRERVRQADFSAINATAALYHITPEQFEEIMRAMRIGHDQDVPPMTGLEKTADPVPDDNPEIPDEEEDSIDDENA